VEINPFQIADEIENDLLEIETVLTPIVQRVTQLQSEIAELENNSRQFHTLEDYGVNLEDLRRMRFLYFEFGDIPVEREYYDRLAGGLTNVPCALLRGDVVARRQQIMVLGLMSDRETISGALVASYFSKTIIPEKYRGHIADVLDEIEVEIWAKREEMAELQGKIQSLRRSWSGRLLELRAEITANQIVAESMGRLGKTERLYLLSGWVPYRDVGKLQKRLENAAAQGIYMTADEPVKAQEAEHHQPRVPTKLSHPFFLRPFAGLITNFDTPRYSAIDPTIFASLAYLVMFGIMFADVGHGGILLLLGLFGALYPLPQLKPIRRLSALLACCGGASLIAGLVFGSLFGKEEIIKPLWFSLEHMKPESVNRMLKLGVFFGIGVLSMGVSLNIAQSFRRKNFKEAFCGQWGIFSLVSYWIVVFLMITKIGFSWDKILIVVLLLIPIMLKEPVSRLVGKRQEHGEEETGESMIGSGFQVYEIVLAYLANTLSFIRVAAFDLSHAGLMMAAYSLTKGGNLFLSLPSDIISNIGVVALEGLIVSIQCMRLEYYEFFSKFFAGEGVEYKPLKIREERLL